MYRPPGRLEELELGDRVTELTAVPMLGAA